MIITIRPGPDEHLAQVTRELWDLADGDRTRVRTGGGGLLVDEELARAWLNARAGEDEPAARAATTTAPAARRRTRAPRKSATPARNKQQEEGKSDGVDV